MKKILKNLFRETLLKNILFTCLVIAIFFPLYDLFYIIPSHSKLLIENTEKEAQRTANHLAATLLSEESELGKDCITGEFKKEVKGLQRDFKLEKLKVFSKIGETIFSSDPDDIGKRNKEGYFREIVLNGRIFSKMVQKNTKTLEGRIVKADVIEIYVPIMRDDTFLGALEINYDITERKGNLLNLLFRSSSILFSFSALLLTIVTLLLFKASKTTLERKQVQEALNSAQEGLEKKISKRTADLVKSNRELHKEIKERGPIETALRESEEKFRLISEQSLLGIVIIQGGIIKYANQAMSDIIGYDLEEMMNWGIGKFSRAIHQDDFTFLMEEMRKKQREDPMVHRNVHFHAVTKSGDVKWLDLYSKDLEYEGKNALFASVIDITDKERAEEEKNKLETQLMHAQRMEAIGTLAGGIAHNFNNLLMGIQGNATLVRLEIEPDNPMKKRIENIEKLVQDGSRLTNQLLGYASEGRYESMPINFNRLLRETAHTFGETKKDIIILQDLDDELLTIEADQGQIEQILLNLFVNAADAMPMGGEFLLKTENIGHDEMTGKPYKVKPGNYVLLTVRDTGEGMDPDIMDRIFEPFFTTKGLARGTGLGLASVYGIVKGHAGYIDVESEKGGGTAFSIYLPASEKKMKPSIKPKAQIFKGQETILLIDDEETILEIGVEVLGFLGYGVLEAKSGTEAIDIYETEKGKIDLVILDMVMPGMGGDRTYDLLKNMNPDIKVLLSSGYSGHGKAKEILKRGCNGFIQKPFNIENLSHSIRNILDNV